MTNIKARNMKEENTGGECAKDSPTSDSEIGSVIELSLACVDFLPNYRFSVPKILFLVEQNLLRKEGAIAAANQKIWCICLHLEIQP